MDGHTQVSFGVGRVLEFNHRDRHAIQKDCQIRADARPRRAGYGELTHDQQVVRSWVLEIYKAGTSAAHLTAGGVRILDLDAIGEQAMKPAVVLDERRMWRVRDNAYDLFYRAMWEDRVQPVQYGREAAL